jgi:hypothetical protein
MIAVERAGAGVRAANTEPAWSQRRRGEVAPFVARRRERSTYVAARCFPLLLARRIVAA